MSGHSKWNNIKHKKEKADAAKAKIFTKIGKDFSLCGVCLLLLVLDVVPFGMS